MASRKVHRKANRKSRRNRKYHSRVHSGGMAPVDYVNKQPMVLNLAQGSDFARYHVGQHGGMAPYPGGVVGSMLPGDLVASSRTGVTLAALNEAQRLQDGGRKRRGSRKNRKSRKNRRQNGGVLVPWGGGRRNRRNSRKNRRNSSCSSRKSRRGRRSMYGGAGSNFAVDAPMLVPESYKQLIPESLRQQAGLHQEWADAANPSSMMPKH